jgi:aryl-alcohol dehydrogenase-like predicted oxidoreductase
MEVALGTVQFGLIYGVAGGRVSLRNSQIRKILEAALEHGIVTLDTAPLYGDIESRLESLCAGLEFRINSKIPPIPPELDSIAAAHWVVESARCSRRRLGRKLTGLMFHRAEDLVGERGRVVWSMIREWASEEKVSLGVSGYDANLVRSICDESRVSIVQLPGNAFDLRHREVFARLPSRPELQLRSAFLQGLLLLPVEVAIARVPEAAEALQHWHKWLADCALTPLRGALSIVKGFQHADTCVIGVDDTRQLEEIMDTWVRAQPLVIEELACDNPFVIDPRCWKEWRQ